MLNATFVILLFGAFALFFRLRLIQSLQERVMLVALIANHFIFMVVLLAYKYYLEVLLDLVLVYGMLSVLSTIAITKFITVGSKKCSSNL